MLDRLLCVRVCVRQVAEITASIVDVRAAFALLSEFKVLVPRDKLEFEWEAYRCPLRIAERMAATDAILDKEKQRYMNEMADEQTNFMDHLNSISLEVNNLARFTDLKEVDKASSAVAIIKRQLEVRTGAGVGWDVGRRGRRSESDVSLCS